MVATHIVDDRLIETVPADTHGLRIDNAVERYHRDFGSATADIEHHRTARLADRNTGTDGSRHGFLDQKHITGTSALGGFLDRAALDLGRTARHANQHARTRTEHARTMHLADELLEHFLGHREISDHAILEWTHGDDVAGRAAEHLPRV